jgi:large subunit ribosomal protein L31e
VYFSVFHLLFTDASLYVASYRNVRIDTTLNKQMFAQGVRNIQKRVRVRLERRRDEDEEATEKMYTLAKYVEVSDFKGLQTQNVVSEA